ncbi:MAG: hypothetical protein L6R28_08665 [Planctomycetes bacterium]|nr:hypothetical protein [Planctomycetota bacterium]
MRPTAARTALLLAALAASLPGCGKTSKPSESASAAAPADAPKEAASLDTLLAHGQEAEARGDAEAAFAAYVKAAQAFADSADAWALLGEAQRFYKHNADAARAAFEKALAAADRSAWGRAFALRGLGELEFHAGKLDEARARFEASLKEKPLVDAHRSLCALLGRRGDFAGAAEQARLAAEMEGDEPIALLLYATQLERAGEAAKASEIATKALALAGAAPADPQRRVHCCVYYNAACWHAVGGRRAEALKMLEAFFATPNHRHLGREELLSDPDLASLKDDPGFRALLDGLLAE